MLVNIIIIIIMFYYLLIDALFQVAGLAMEEAHDTLVVVDDVRSELVPDDVPHLRRHGSRRRLGQGATLDDDRLTVSSS